jgi:exopolysaccharide production protein ExoZ
LTEPAAARPAFEGEIQSLQFLRFLAALMVVVYHAGFAARQHGLLGPAQDAWLDLTAIGKSGVHIFFVISGFIMVYATRHSGRDGQATGRFLYRRVVRIYPIYWLYCGLYAAFHAWILHPHALAPWDVLGALLLWPGHSAMIIGPGWTLSYEVYFYLCFAACMPLGAPLSLRTLTGLIVSAVAAGFLIGKGGPSFEVLTSTLLLEFLAGVWIAVLVIGDRPLPALVAPAAIACAAAGFLAPAFLGFPDIPTVILWGVPSALLVFGMTLQERRRRTPRIVRRLSPLGNGSYSLYLLHNLLLDVIFVALLAAGASDRHGWAWTALAVLACCVVSAHAYRFVEAPLLAGLVHRRRRPVGAAAG